MSMATLGEVAGLAPPPTRFMDAMLCCVEPTHARKNHTIEKLAQRGVRVIKQLDPVRVSAESLRGVDIVVIMQMGRSSVLNEVERIAREHDVPYFTLPYSTSHGSWQRMTTFVLAHGHEESSSSEARTRRPVIYDTTVPPSSPATAAAPEDADEVSLAELYAEETEALRAEAEGLKAEKEALAAERDAAAAERNRLALELADVQKELDEQTAAFEKAREAAAKLAAHTESVDEAAKAVLQSEKLHRERADHAEKLATRAIAELQQAKERETTMMKTAGDSSALNEVHDVLRETTRKLGSVDRTANEVVDQLLRMSVNNERALTSVANTVSSLANTVSHATGVLDILSREVATMRGMLSVLPFMHAQQQLAQPAPQPQPTPSPTPPPVAPTQPEPAPAPKPSVPASERPHASSSFPTVLHDEPLAAAPIPAPVETRPTLQDDAPPPSSPRSQEGTKKGSVKAFILDYLSAHPRSSARAIMDANPRLSRKQISNGLSHLVERHSLQRDLSSRPPTYYLATQSAAPTPGPGPAATRVANEAPPPSTAPSASMAPRSTILRLMASEKPRAILNFVRHHPGTTVAPVAKAVGSERAYAGRILRELMVHGFVERAGYEKAYTYTVTSKAPGGKRTPATPQAPRPLAGEQSALI